MIESNQQYGRSLTILPIHPSISQNSMLGKFLIPLLALIIICLKRNSDIYHHLLVSIALSVIGFYTTYKLIIWLSPRLLTKGISGKDLNKIQEPNPDVPEALGLAPCSVFIVMALISQIFFSRDIQLILEYNEAVLSITLMSFMGFADDIIDIPWRWKTFLPLAAVMPLIIGYRGSTYILLPDIFKRFFLVNGLELGYFYHVYMAMLSVFCTNSINIFAGINGLEIGQSLIIAISVVIHNVWELNASLNDNTLTVLPLRTQQHLFSLTLCLLYIFCVCALCCFNWFPSKVFVGDTFTLFSGMFFAVISILGHFSRTTILFFIPQILNLLISLPQLFGLMHCPKHRIPRISDADGLLHPSPNLTILNMYLRVTGAKSELTLVIQMLFLQTLCSIVGLSIRYSPMWQKFFI